jgi:hypothetical protein
MNRAAGKSSQRGFTVQEKWVIWGAFCLLVALSTYRVSVFVGLLLIPAGIMIFKNGRKKVLGLLLSVAGLAVTLLSKYLI